MINHTKRMACILACMMVLTGTVNAQWSYPDVSRVAQNPMGDNSPPPSPSVQQSLVDFLASWSVPPSGASPEDTATLSDVMQRAVSELDANSADVRTLASVASLAQLQLKQSQSLSEPLFSFSTDAANPVYGFTRNPVGTSMSSTHRFGAGASVSLQLPTSGTFSAALRSGSQVSSVDTSGTWTWKHVPTVSLALQQPLGLGGMLINPEIQDLALAKQRLTVIAAEESLESVRNQLALQVTKLVSSRQGLLEQRWLAMHERQQLAVELEDAAFDKESGRINDLQYKALALSLGRLDARVEELDASISAVERSMEMTAGRTLVEKIPRQLKVSDLIAVRSLEVVQRGLIGDDQLLAQLLEADDSYRQAKRDLQAVDLDDRMGTGTALSMLSVSMQLSPSYTPTDGASFVESFADLFASGSPVVSIAVSLSAGNLGGRGNSLLDDARDQRRMQASIALAKARDAVQLRLFELQDAIDAGLASLATSLTAYDLAIAELEIEQVRNDAGLSGPSAVARKSRAVYQTAFTVLGVLRSLELSWLEFEAMK